MTDLATLLTTTRLEAIDVVHLLCQRNHPGARGPLAYPPRLTKHLRIDVRHADTMPEGGATFLIVMQARWIPENGEEADTVALGEVHLRVAYAFADETHTLTAEVAKDFGHKVALHNAWPHLRQRLQQMCVELGLNPVLLPLKPLAITPVEA